MYPTPQPNILSLLFNMAQAILDLHANTEDTAMLEVGELPTTAWSGMDMDMVRVSNNTYNRMERDLQRALLQCNYSLAGCKYRNNKQLRLMQHMESHYIIYICSCGNFASYCNTTTKHGRTRHHDNKPGLT